MFKLGRGGGGGGRGGGASKRPLPPSGPSIPLRSSGPHRGGGTGRGGLRPSPGGAARSPAVSAGGIGKDESFCIEPRGGPLDFAAIIRLTPDIVEEIRRVEAQGGEARIKFDSNSNNSSGNVIDVGGKEFRFTWSGEVGDLCDIYEERQSGEDGNGLLVECGSVWRKLNVQRILDESTKNHVKMRSEEAERLSKSRKAIVLDPTNPSVKSQATTMVAAALEGNMRRGWKQKKEFFKKRKLEPTLASTTAITKSTTKLSSSARNLSKGRPSLSPAPSPSEQLPVGTANFTIKKGCSPREEANHDDILAALTANNDSAGNLEKETPTVIEILPTSRERTRNKSNNGSRPTDLEAC